MVANIDKLKGKITENRYTMKRLSKELGMSETTLRNKMNNEKSEDFYVSESWELKKILKLSIDEYLEIFFGEN